MSAKSKLALLLIAAALTAPAGAQQPGAGATGGAAVASEPGKAAIVRAVELSSLVVGIDRATRTLTLSGAKGDVHRSARALRRAGAEDGRNQAQASNAATRGHTVVGGRRTP